MIEIVPYDPRWPRDYADEAARIATALGPRALRIEHVGSTAVPGLAAKPVIDLQVSVATLEPREPFDDALARLGYRFVPLGDFDRVYPFYTRPRGWPGTHHLHLCTSGSAEEREHLAFRDRLRADPAAAAGYEALKRALAARHHGRTLASQEAYSLSKTAFVRAIVGQPAA